MTISMPSPVMQHPFWHLLGVGLFLVLWCINLRLKTSGIFLLALWNLAGVILHETSHLAVGILLWARPAGFSLVPQRVGDRWQLGSVKFSAITAINAVPIALAPLTLAVIAYLVAINWFTWVTQSLATTLELYLVLFVLVYNSLPSRQDLRVACNLRSMLLYVPLLALTACILIYMS